MAQTTSKTLRLLVFENEEIYRHMYQLIGSRGPIDLLGVSDNSDIDMVKHTISTSHPDVLLLGTKRLESNIIEELDQIRLDYPKIAIVLLFASYSTKDIDSLRKLAVQGHSGMAAFLRQSLDQIDQLVGIIMAVSHGQIILDPTLANLLLAGKPDCPFLQQLTKKELEVLSLLAKGQTNAGIAESLYIDVKTVEHHLNCVYSKLKTDGDYSHKRLRVAVTRRYLKETGELVHS